MSIDRGEVVAGKVTVHMASHLPRSQTCGLSTDALRKGDKHLSKSMASCTFLLLTGTMILVLVLLNVVT